MEGRTIDETSLFKPQPEKSHSALSEIEREQILHGFNSTSAMYPEDGLIHSIFQARAEQRPDAIALISGDQRLTYAQLNSRANCVAHALLSQGVRPDDRIGLCIERSLDLVIGLLGILKAGAAYVPLDPAYPTERLAFMIEDSSPKVILTHTNYRARLPTDSRMVILMDREPLANTDNPIIEGLTSRSLAYVTYTSGSTGRSKGVMIEHRSVLRLVINASYAPVGPDDCVAHCASPSFDAATWEIWAPLQNGARVLLIPPSTVLEPVTLNQVLVQHGVTALFISVGLFHEYVDLLEEAFGGLKYLLVGGDVPSASKLARLLNKRSAPQHLLNVYGPTETTTFATAFPITKADLLGRAPPIGRPITNTQVYVLDNRGYPVPRGIVGEIFIGGPGVARGYINQSALTSDRFVADPFSKTPGDRLYKSGDLGFWRSDGILEFIGRNDLQVKIRGFRVEPGEIEVVLQSHYAVKQAVVVAREDKSGQKSLVGYVVLDLGLDAERRQGEQSFQGNQTAVIQKKLDIEASLEQLTVVRLREFLASRLPQYMIPRSLVVLDRLPLTPNGKVDRQALPEPAARSASKHAPIENLTALEEILGKKWMQLLKLDRIGIDENFFELGGHSILGLRLAAEISQALSIQLPTIAVYQHPSIRSMASFIETTSISSAVVASRQNVIRVLDSTSEKNPASLSQLSEMYPRLGPLSCEQSNFWRFTQTYHDWKTWVTSQLRVRGSLDINLLARSLIMVIQRHEALRTRIVEVDGDLMQQVDSPGNESRLEVLDVSDSSESVALVRAQSHIDTLFRRPANVAGDDLFRMMLLKISHNEYMLAVSIHHVVCDAVSLIIFFRDLWSSYEHLLHDQRSALPAADQYLDYAIWQRGEIVSSANIHASYWADKLSGTNALRMPPDHACDNPSLSNKHAEMDIFFGEKLTDGLQELGRATQTVPPLVILTAYAALASSWCDQTDFVIPIAVTGRPSSSHVDTIGLFAGGLPLRILIDRKRTFVDLIMSVSREFLSAYANYDYGIYSFQKPEISQGTFLNWVGDPDELAGLPSLSGCNSLDAHLKVESCRSTALSAAEGFELTSEIVWGFERSWAGIHGRVHYRTDLFTRSMMQAFVCDLQRIAEHMVTNPSSVVDSFQPMRSS